VPVAHSGPVSRATLTAKNITKHFGSELILNGVSLTVHPGARIGLIGPNGVGKSTLLRILSGAERPDEGVVLATPPSMTVGYMAQEIDDTGAQTLMRYLSARTGVATAEAELRSREEALARDESAAEAYSHALDRWLALGGADLEARAGRACATVGLSDDRLGVPLDALSGGQIARAGLAALLLSRFDLLLLDEPTNNLDFGGLRVLERFVASTPGAVVVVSHDRAFLERHIERVVEIDEGSHSVVEYSGGWEQYLAERARARVAAYDAHERYVAEQKRLQEAVRRKQQWARKGAARAQRSGEPDRHIRHAQRQGAEGLGAGVRTIRRRMEALLLADKPWESWELRLEIAAAPRGGDLVFRLERAVVARGSWRLGPLDLAVYWGDRVAIVGPNGGGKTTLLHTLLGDLTPESGRCRRGSGVVLGTMDQDRSSYRSSRSALEVFRESVDATDEAARSVLAKFGLGSVHLARPAQQLSPGERTRCLLAAHVVRGVNCLTLDEPTNHLDLSAIEELAGALGAFAGTILMVSHDRWLLDAFEPTRVLEVRAGTVLEHHNLQNVSSGDTEAQA
jgi:ATPase subunit of ABC transporter with duplicated ATPase domains